MTHHTSLGRENLPIPDPQWVGVTTYDAKDPDTKFPPIEPIRPPDGAPNVLIVLLDDVGFGASSAFGGPCNTPNFERLAEQWLEIHPVPHHRSLLPDPGRPARRPQPSLGGHGRDHRDRHLRTGLQLDAAPEQGADRRDAQAQRLLHGPFREVPRGPGLGDQPDGARSTAGRARAMASSTSTGSSAGRPTSTPPPSTRTRCPSSRTAPRRRVTTSPRT